VTNAEENYHKAAGVKGAEASQMFGKPCYKTGGKAFVSFFQECMVFKLDPDTREEALALSGAQLFDPSGKKRPMKEWVQLPVKHKEKWKKFARAAFDYVREG
jgi:hypothetical protein